MRSIVLAAFVSTIFVDAILIPNGGGGGCYCPETSPCSFSPPPAPCSCQVIAHSSGRTHVPAKSSAINFFELKTAERKLVAITSKEIRRHPTADASSVTEPSDAEELSRVSGNSHNTTEQTISVDGGLDHQSKCNSQVFKKLITESINEESSNESKRAISAAAELKFGGVIGVICSRGHFSYVYMSSLFCEATKGAMTCVAFRQAEKD